MRKLYSLVRACMSSDMNLFKIKHKKNSKAVIFLPIFISLYLMFMMWGGANSLFEKLAPMNLQFVLLSGSAFLVSFMTIMEGIYKAGPLLFNCKDDQLLLSLPIERRTVFFVRVFKFYVFELLFNSLFIIPVMVAYIRWAEELYWTYFLTCIVMLFILPIIPIVIASLLGFISSSLSSRFKYKNASQIIISMIFLVGILFLSYNSDGFMEYVIKNSTSVNDLITKIYYPAGVYAKLVTDFHFIDLIIFIFINIVIFVIAIFVLSKFYFKINSRLKKVTSNKSVSVNKLVIKSRPKIWSLVLKELNTFFKTPVFIINAGFAMVLFIIGSIIFSFKFDSALPFLTSKNGGLGLSKDLIMNNLSVLIFGFISFSAYMTSITNSVISLEGKSFNILKSLPLQAKTILMSKVLSSLVLTTPVFLFGDMILFIRFKIGFIDSILLIILSILVPLVSHFVGILINLKFPKLDAENSSEVVKQSISSLLSVMIGMILLMISVTIISSVIGKFQPTLILGGAVIIYLIIDGLLYLYLINKGVMEFNDLSM